MRTHAQHGVRIRVRGHGLDAGAQLHFVTRRRPLRNICAKRDRQSAPLRLAAGTARAALPGPGLCSLL